MRWFGPTSQNQRMAPENVARNVRMLIACFVEETNAALPHCLTAFFDNVEKDRKYTDRTSYWTLYKRHCPECSRFGRSGAHNGEKVGRSLASPVLKSGNFADASFSRRRTRFLLWRPAQGSRKNLFRAGRHCGEKLYPKFQDYLNKAVRDKLTVTNERNRV
jgi:hypothetical protein